MGILVADERKFTHCGLTLSNFVATIGGSFLLAKRYIDIEGVTTAIYSIDTMVHYYASLEAYNNRNNPESRVEPCIRLSYSFDIEASQITSDLYELFYSKLVQACNFTNVSNC